MEKPIQLLEYFEKAINNSAQRFAVFSTCENQIPFSRYVVLRQFNLIERQIRFYTHSHSRKIKQIESNPASDITWFDSNKNLQIIFKGKSFCESNQEIINKVKATLPGHSLKDYMGMNPGGEYQEIQSEEINLSIIKFKIQKIDLLLLRKSEHLRFQLQPIANPPDGNIEFNITRLTP